MVSSYQLYKELSWAHGFFFVLSLILIVSSWLSIRKAVEFEDSICSEIARRKFTQKVDGVVNLVPADKDLVGFFVGNKYYPVDCEDGSYTVTQFTYDGIVTFYSYRFADTTLNMLVVKDPSQEVNAGGIMVYKR